MKEIKKGIVFSYDMKKIVNGENALKYQYPKVPPKEAIESLREDFTREVKKYFKNVSIITEEEMESITNLIEGRYPHYYAR